MSQPVTQTAPSASDAARAREEGRGRQAERPSEIPARGWYDIFWRIWAKLGTDRVTLVAAGATFYLLLALFPALAAFVSLYGFVADPRTVAEHVAYLGAVLPSGGLDIIREQLQNLTREDRDALSIGFIVALLTAFWSSNNGVKTLFEALNIAYDETEKRSFIRLNIAAFAFTLGAIVVASVMLFAVGVVPAALAILRLEGYGGTIVAVLRWPLIIAVAGLGISLIYRYGPSRERAQWRWVTWGSALATVVWVVASAGFSFYLQNFADYNATYGSLGAVMGLMLWTWISVIILIVGAQLNAEIEHQTAVDTTTGDPKPMGMRNAVVADTVGVNADG